MPDAPTQREIFLELSGSGSAATLNGPPTGLMGSRLATSDGGANGIFVEWNWDGSRFDLSTDRYGFFPLYYWQSGNTLRLATSIPALVRAGASSEIDDDAMAVFLRLGFFVGDDTPFRSIRALPPGARISWTTSRMELRSEPPRSQTLDVSRESALDRYGELFRNAVERLSANENGVARVLPLSGGQDSRHILLQLLELGRPPTMCVTTRHYPPRGTPDTDIAREVARATGVPHRVLEQPFSQLQNVLRHHAATNLCTLTPGFFMQAVNDYISGRSAVVYDGLAGDVLSAGLFATPARARAFAEGQLTTLAEDILDNFEGGGGHSDRTLELTLDEATLQRCSRQAAVSHLSRELEKHLDAANPMLSFCFFNRTRRDVALLPCRALASAAAVHTPFLDHAVFDFLSSLPPEICMEKTFHKETIIRQFPQWAHLPFAGYFVADDTHARAHFRRFAGEVLGYTRGGLGVPGLRRSSVAPRLFMCSTGGSYGKAVGWLGPLLLYLQQLENLIAEIENDSDG
jgi:asparagine synthetase B (glutamine-hydrolysing)